ncbi:MAG: hypothetical protein KKG60_02850 [Nanoarchaeota archaeon]|nr:hypothetical protein [Nanoarchaeota archaeon]
MITKIRETFTNAAGPKVQYGQVIEGYEIKLLIWKNSPWIRTGIEIPEKGKQYFLSSYKTIPNQNKLASEILDKITGSHQTIRDTLVSPALNIFSKKLEGILS